MESFPKCDFIPVDFYEVRHVKASFKKLMRACVPSAPLTQETGFLKLVEESEWLLQVNSWECDGGMSNRPLFISSLLIKILYMY